MSDQLEIYEPTPECKVVFSHYGFPFKEGFNSSTFNDFTKEEFINSMVNEETGNRVFNRLLEGGLITKISNQ